MKHKNFIVASTILFLGLLFVAQMGQASPTAQNTPPLGDVSCDDESNTVDALFILQFNVGLRTTSPNCPLSDSATQLVVQGCDVNEDTACNTVDALFILQCNVGLDNSFCPLPLLTTLDSSSPADGESGVAVTRETWIQFSDPLDPATVTATNIFAQFGGDLLEARLELSADGRKVTLFYTDPLPASARVRVTINGDGLLNLEGNGVDADDDGLFGGTTNIDFDTLTLTTLPNTVVCGQVFASELANGANLPLENVKITVDSLEDTLFALTDSLGNFCLDPAPAGRFFVHIDGRTATNPIEVGAYYPFVGKAWESLAGQTTNIGDVFLPLVVPDTLQAVSQTEDTTITFAQSVLNEFPELQGVEIMVPADSLYADDGTRGGMVGIAPVAPDRLPGQLPEGLNFPLVITVQTDGATNFDEPVPICFPNLPDPNTGVTLEVGEKSALWSFDHDIGRFEIAGPMTVAEEGTLICTDFGIGVLEPGWHGAQAGSSGSGGRTEDDSGCPSPGGHPAERIACLAAKPAYCEAKFGSPCRASCNKYASVSSDSFARCISLCSIWQLQCLASNVIKCPFDTPTCNDIPATTNVTSLDKPIFNSLQGMNAGEMSLLDEEEPTSAMFYGIENRDVMSGTIQLRGIASNKGDRHVAPILLAPNTNYREHILHPDGRLGFADFQTSASGSRFDFPTINYGPPTSPDEDNDGLTDYGEFVLGTDYQNPDTDNDGLFDGIELQYGTNPLSGFGVQTGMIAASDTPGNAIDICATNEMVLVADEAAGISIFSPYSGTGLTTIARVDTPGEALRVACASETLVAVADGSKGVAIIDISDPPAAFIKHQINQYQLGGQAQAIALAGSTIFVGTTTGQLVSIDLQSGSILDRTNLPEAIQDLAVEKDTLYALTTTTLYAIPLNAGPLAVAGIASSLSSSFTNLRLFVGGGIAYATHNTGYNTFDLSTPNQPVLITNGTTAQLGWKQMAMNGSGLGVAAVGSNLSNDGPHHINLYDVSDPAQTDQFLTTFQTPGRANTVAIYNGLAYVADGQFGLEVINYLAYDTLGEAPGTTLTASFPLSPAAAEEGQALRVSADVFDDVQVRNVAFYIDGIEQTVDGSFPFEYRFVAPRIIDEPTFTVQAKATDTGGNFTWTPVYTVSLTADTTAPSVLYVSPREESLSGNATAVAAFMNEPIDLTTLLANGFTLHEAGPDGFIGTGDDVVIQNGQIEWDAENQGAFIRFEQPLPSGFYQAELKSAVADLAGNPLTANKVWIFRVFDVTDDGDGDCIPDQVELSIGLDPTSPDSDSDTLLDGDEDFDNDGLSNCAEVIIGTNVNNEDTDGDGVLDGDEDSDSDDLSDLAEISLYGTDLFAWDSDGDNFSDGSEIANGSNPQDSASTPITVSSLPGEVGSPIISIINMSSPIDFSSLPGEAVSPVISIINISGSVNDSSILGDVVSPATSIINLFNPVADSQLDETLMPPFRIPNRKNP